MSSIVNADRDTKKTTTWAADPSHSVVGFSVRHMMISRVRGNFAQFESTVELDEEDLTRSKITAKIDAASVNTSAEDRDGHLKSADFFDVEKYPHLTFESTGIEDLGDDKLRIRGNLTIRDVTKEVVLDVTDEGGGKDPWGNQRRGFTAQTKINREDFGLEWNQALETGGVLVGKEVRIELELQFVEQTE